MIKLNTERPRNLLVFVNPFGGKGRAKRIWEEKISNIFKISNIKSKVIITERADHALTVVQSVPLHHYDGLVSVGGDGMLAEVFNGLILRAAKDDSIDVDTKDAEFAKPSVRVGFIPCGSTDTVSMSLHGTTDPGTAALHIVLGHRLDMDVLSVHSNNKLERFVMSMLSYGYLGDLMKHSERLRWLGPHRYEVSGVKTFLSMKSYKGTVSYTGVYGDCLEYSVCVEGCTVCCEDTEELPSYEVFTVSGKFLGVTAANLPCSSSHSKTGLAPAAHRGNGCVDLILIHGSSRINYFRYLFRTAFNTSHPFNLQFVQTVRVREWNFTPQDKNSENSVWNCDGEILEDPEISVRVHRKLLPVFAR